jgi:hypothetical protein
MFRDGCTRWCRRFVSGSVWPVVLSVGFTSVAREHRTMAATSDSARSLTTVGTASGALTAVALGLATLRTGSAELAAVVAAVSGGGAFLFVPYLVRLDRFGRADADSDADGRRVNPGAVGASLAATGFVILALALILEDPLLAVGIAIPLAVLEFVIWSLALPRAARSPKGKPPIHRQG